MNKLIMVAFLVLVVTGMFFTSGCTGPTEGQTTITSDAEASDTVSDLGSDVSGISETLDGIDSELG